LIDLVFPTVGHYVITVNVTNPVSEQVQTTSTFIDEPIDGIRMKLLTPEILVIGSGANGVTAKVRPNLPSPSTQYFDVKCRTAAPRHRSTAALRHCSVAPPHYSTAAL
jgi:hypothetical protein